MSIRKHGVGEVLTERDDDKKTASANFSDEDRAKLDAECASDEQPRNTGSQ